MTKPKCLECGEVMTVRREARRFDALPTVVLKKIEVRRCPNCGEEEVVIPRLDELIRVVAMAVVEKDTRLTGPEVRFLRKSLGWSGVDFAAYMGARPEAVSRWETGAEKIGPQSDRLLRMFVVHGVQLTDYSRDVLKNVDRAARPTRIEAKLKAKAKDNVWQTAAHA